MAKRETFFNIIQSSKYLDELDLKSKEKEEKTFETGNFRWTFIKEYHGDELEIYIQYTNLHYLYHNSLNYKLTKTARHKESILGSATSLTQNMRRQTIWSIKQRK